MKNIYIGLTILLFSSILNYYTDFSFLLNSDILIFLWLLFYSIILPIGLMSYAFGKYKSTSNLFRINLSIFLLYLISVFFSSLGLLDYKKFEIEGDGATRYVIRIILCICFVSSFLTLLFFLNKSKKYNKST